MAASCTSWSSGFILGNICVFFNLYVVLMLLSTAYAVETLNYDNFKEATSMSTKIFALFCKSNSAALARYR